MTIPYDLLREGAEVHEIGDQIVIRCMNDERLLNGAPDPVSG